MFLTKSFAQRSLISNRMVWNLSRALQRQPSTQKPSETLPIQNRKPKFDAIHFEESVKAYAEDITLENQHEKLSNMMLPLANHSYDEQLKIKQEIVGQSFEQIGRAILWDKRIDGQVLKYVEFQEGHFCHVEPIIPSSITEHYRCKDDLSCGYGVDGQKTVGFYINPRNNKKFPNALCVPPIHLKSMKPKHRLVVKHFDQFLKQHPLSICENATVLKKDQYWRFVTLKSNEQDHLIMTVVVHPQSLTKNELDQMKKDLLNYFIDGSGRECEINSIYFQTCADHRCTSEQNPFELIHGDEFIYEIYHEKKFRISPESFLQANKKSAESVYSTIFEHAQIDNNTVLLDIGSGIGVYSILASSLAKKVYAIDPLSLCIEDGKFNAKLNQCRDNIEWICGFAEAHLHRILKKIGDLHGDHSPIVAIVNPSRYSSTTKTTSVLRSLTSIRRVFYDLSKTDEQTMHNFYELAAGERSKLKPISRPFIPTDVYPIDLLPHTTHAEIVVKCVRILIDLLAQSMASINDDSYESIGLVKPEVYVYVIPPRQSATRKHRAADWKLDAPNFICRLKIISKAEKCLIRLEDRNTGGHFATCPVESYPSMAVENVEDSTRYFVIRVQSDNGQQAFLGIGFNDRSDSFDFNVALQDHFKYLKQAKQIEQEAKEPFKQQQPKLDLSFKEGQTIKINLKSTLPGEDAAKKPMKTNNEAFVPGILPPPPGSTIPKLTPPPGSTIPKIAPPPFAQSSPSTTTATPTAANTNDIHSDLSWMQF